MYTSFFCSLPELIRPVPNTAFIVWRHYIKPVCVCVVCPTHPVDPCGSDTYHIREEERSSSGVLCVKNLTCIYEVHNMRITENMCLFHHKIHICGYTAIEIYIDNIWLSVFFVWCVCFSCSARRTGQREVRLCLPIIPVYKSSTRSHASVFSWRVISCVV